MWMNEHRKIFSPTTNFTKKQAMELVNEEEDAASSVDSANNQTEALKITESKPTEIIQTTNGKNGKKGRNGANQQEYDSDEWEEVASSIILKRNIIKKHNGTTKGL
jgi:hypothetical protein